MIRFRKTLAVPLMLAAFVVSGAARANMAVLSDPPSPATPESCEAWAAQQDEEAVYMWGMLFTGGSSNSVGLKRLALSCIGDPKPEIVGFGSSVGFDDAYCRKHRKQAICTKR